MFPKISYHLLPRVHALHNPKDYEYIGFYSHDYVILHETLDMELAVLILGHDHVRPLKAEYH